MAQKKKKSQPSLSKQQKLVGHLRQNLLSLIYGKNYRPIESEEIFDKLSLPLHHKEAFQDAVASLIDDKQLIETRGLIYPQREGEEIVTGKLSVHPRGFAFLKVEHPKTFSEDVFIPKHLTNFAVDGDKVEALILTSTPKGPEGKVIAILERARSHLAGIITRTSRDQAYAYAPLLGENQQVVVKGEGTRDLKDGDRVVLEVVEWGQRDGPTSSKLSHVIGSIDDPSTDITAAIEEYELRSDFPNEVLEEAAAFGSRVSTQEIKKREDLREWEIFTIDPDTAKDFDDALSLTKDTKGHYHLGVHIADVSHYVQSGSKLDEEAKIRCNSTYFPGRCIPMLPKELSESLCSLKPGVNRLTVSVHMEFNGEGTLLSHRISRSVIKSACRFTYRQAKEVLDGTRKSPHAATLRLMESFCKLLKKKRRERGSVEFNTTELSVIVDEKGVPQKMDWIPYDVTHQLVEEFMLKANEMVAVDLSSKGKNLAYRIHDEPDKDTIQEFVMLARSFGFKLSEDPSPQELQILFEDSAETPYGAYLVTSYIRCMRLAVYSAENIGHFGLGLTHYCHFTSPIRRYVDLVIHRLLFGTSDDITELDETAKTCSNQERVSAKAEASVKLLKKLRLLDKEPKQSYEAVITKARPFGITFEVLAYGLEGFLHVSQLSNDYYDYVEDRKTLVGRHTGTSFTVGNKISVKLEALDLIQLQASWYLESKKVTKKGK